MSSINSVNGLTQATSSYSAYSSTAVSKTTEEAAASTAQTTEEVGAVYEPSTETTTDSTKKTYTANTELVNKLKADADARTAQLQSLVEKLISKQSTAYANANDMWSILSSGNFTVDAATKAQAQADISEDGYWGVSQTSDRIIDFATALTGGDPDKIEEMREAFQKGYKQAEKTWGGSLPEISQKTYEAVMQKFDELAEQAGVTTE